MSEENNVIDFTQIRLKKQPIEYTVVFRHDENGMSFSVNDVEDSPHARMAVARDLEQAAKLVVDDQSTD